MKTPIEYIKQAWGIYTKKENFVYFSKVMAVLLLFSAVPSVIMTYFYSSRDLYDFGYVALSIVAAVGGLWSSSTVYQLLINLDSINDPRDILRLGFKKIIKYFFASLVLGLTITVGILLLVIPGIIFAVWFVFTVYLYLDKQMGIIESFKASRKIVSGKFMKIAGRIIVFGLLSFVVGLISTAFGSFGVMAVSFVAPFLALPLFLLYKDLVVESY